MQGLVELSAANLFDDVRVAGLVNLECFAAVLAIDFLHSHHSQKSDRFCALWPDCLHLMVTQKN
jgi:hypothetical protein